jgi:hypothetical protein
MGGTVSHKRFGLFNLRGKEIHPSIPLPSLPTPISPKSKPFSFPDSFLKFSPPLSKPLFLVAERYNDP